MSPFPPHVVTAPGEQGTDDGSKEINNLDQQATPFASMQLHQDHLRWLLLLPVMVHVWAHDAYFVGLFLLLSFKLTVVLHVANIAAQNGHGSLAIPVERPTRTRQRHQQQEHNAIDAQRHMAVIDNTAEAFAC